MKVNDLFLMHKVLIAVYFVLLRILRSKLVFVKNKIQSQRPSFIFCLYLDNHLSVFIKIAKPTKTQFFYIQHSNCVSTQTNAGRCIKIQFKIKFKTKRYNFGLITGYMVYFFYYKARIIFYLNVELKNNKTLIQILDFKVSANQQFSNIKYYMETIFWLDFFQNELNF
ncbi:hypothetical protein BpHYR1_053394 [Brachionus plicatilis]|uniref:Transmembrane protein n=1 Tax=Brachionus plicatilis TaxID=10195 RepID=A0A3M7QX39_BRAPC|nr:hypothetical protein BpHYR1_053394 [Brachionus plicatilis]